VGGWYTTEAAHALVCRGPRLVAALAAGLGSIKPSRLSTFPKGGKPGGEPGGSSTRYAPELPQGY